jgi:hypothetical protein
MAYRQPPPYSQEHAAQPPPPPPPLFASQRPEQHATNDPIRIAEKTISALVAVVLTTAVMVYQTFENWAIGRFILNSIANAVAPVAIPMVAWAHRAEVGELWAMGKDMASGRYRPAHWKRWTVVRLGWDLARANTMDALKRGWDVFNKELDTYRAFKASRPDGAQAARAVPVS